MEVATAIFLVLAAIFFHEFSHAWVAVALGAKVKRIFVGMPALIIYETEIKGIPISFSLLLFGGGVEIDGEELWKLSRRKKLLVYAYGSMGNIVISLMTAFVFLGLSQGLEVSREMIIATIGSVYKLFTGEVSLDQIMGPVGVIAISAEMIKIHFWLGTLLVWILINNALAVFNALPIPALDGGHMVLSAILHNKPDGRKYWKGLTIALFIPLLVGILLITVNDISRLIN